MCKYQAEILTNNNIWDPPPCIGANGSFTSPSKKPTKSRKVFLNIDPVITPLVEQYTEKSGKNSKKMSQPMVG